MRYQHRLVLEEPSALWARILDASYNGILVIDRAGTIMVYNRAARRIFGNTHKTYVGRHISEIRPEVWPDLEHIINTGNPQIGRKLILKDTTIIANRSPILIDGAVCGIISVFQDISEYERIISELQGFQRLHRELEAIIESSYDGLYVTDGQAKTIRLNRSYERITGLSRNDLLGRSMHDLVSQKVFDHSVTLEVLKKGRQVTIMQMVMGDKQVMVTGTPIYDDAGEIILVVTNVRDITELNALKNELEASRRITSRMYQALQEHKGIEHALENMVIKSQSMMKVVHAAIKVAGTETSILLEGESGVGKSMLARIIHQISNRKDRPFVKINCGAIPGSLIESELFGYEEGAFTGAVPGGKAGMIETAHTGTVFLDEIAELKPDLQAKLLEVIEEKTFTRVGNPQPVSVDVRIIAATNRNLLAMVHRGQFRDDLYYRLHVVPIAIPPLRYRREDIQALAVRMLESFNKAHGTVKRLEPRVVDRLKRYRYPGNVRELINTIERMMIMSEGDLITIEDLPEEFQTASCDLNALDTGGMTLRESVQALERQMILNAVEVSGSLSEAAAMLAIHPTTLWRKMVRHDIQYCKNETNSDIAIQH